MASVSETALIPSNVVSEIVACRDAAVELYRQYFEAIEAAGEILANARAAVNQACAGEVDWPYVAKHVTEVEEFRTACKAPNVEQCKRVATRLTDLCIWGAVIRRTSLEALMDKTAKDELREQLAYVPEEVDHRSGKLINQDEIARGIPPITEDNIHATIERFREDAGTIWRRGIATAFSKLDRRFRSHDGFAIGARIILTRVFSDYGGWNYYSNTRDALRDIERVFLVLDGKSPMGPYRSIVDVIEEDRKGVLDPEQSRHAGEYFECRCFKNGNIHLWFRRDDLLEKVNQLLADHYSVGWGDGEQESDPEAPFSGALERAPARNFGLFPTPNVLADRVIEEANLYSETPLRILEPSAGTGQLARRAAEYEIVSGGWGNRETRLAGHLVTCVEVQPELATALRGGSCARVLCRDFLAMEPEPVYDRVVMNPPFDRGRDIDHAHHAMKFLRPGGRLVAIMSQSAEFSSTKKAEAFRAEVEKHKGKWTDLPEGSFREAGTNVNAVLVTLTRAPDGV